MSDAKKSHHPTVCFAPAPLLSFGQEGKVRAHILFFNSIRELEKEHFSSWSGGEIQHFNSRYLSLNKRKAPVRKRVLYNLTKLNVVIGLGTYGKHTKCLLRWFNSILRICIWCTSRLNNMG